MSRRTILDSMQLFRRPSIPLKGIQYIPGTGPPFIAMVRHREAPTSSALNRMQPRHQSTSSSYLPLNTSSHNASSKTANTRLSQLTRHLSHSPTYEINTPFSTERISVAEDRLDDLLPYNTRQIHQAQPKITSTMSAQDPHPAVMIPGPIEYDDAVLKSMSHFSQSHVGQPFVNTFGETLSLLRRVFQTSNPNSQPVVISGSGTLGWDQVAANLAEPDDDVLVLHTGYFADSFADCFKTYGANPTQLGAPIGGRPQLPEIEKALKERTYKLITVTHVDTSTGVLSELADLSKLVRRVSPETLLIVDGVCSVGAEPINFDTWDLDVVITASQKALGCPAGLSILMASEHAIKVFKSRKTPPNSYFASWANWLPILQNYEAKKPSYFATPSPQLIHALHTACTQILSRPLEERFAKHREVSQRVKKRVTELGLKQLPTDPADQASTMTAIWLPEGMVASDFLPGVLQRGVVFAGGLHKEIATKYIRFGHMGVSVTDDGNDHIEKALKALEERLGEVGFKKS